MVLVKKRFGTLTCYNRKSRGLKMLPWGTPHLPQNSLNGHQTVQKNVSGKLSMTKTKQGEALRLHTSPVRPTAWDDVVDSVKRH